MEEVTLSAAARRSSDVADLARSVIEAGIAPSAAAGFAVRGARWELSVGGATSPEEHAFFDLASLTKPMTALAFARAGIDRRTPLGDLLAEAQGTPSEAVPVELFLAHRAGLLANLPMFEPMVEGGRVSRAEALRAAASARRAEVSGLAAEGAPPVYSDLGYVLVGEALARHVGARDAGEAIEALVVAPLGLVDVLGTARALGARCVDFTERVAPTEVVPWRGGELRGRVHDENAWALTGEGGSGHAGMFGTIAAVLAFGAAALDAVARREGPLASGDLGWLVAERPGGDLRAGFDGRTPGASSAGERPGPRTFGHLGFTGTSLWIDPDANALVALLTNRVHPSRDNVAIRAARPRLHDALWALATRG